MSATRLAELWLEHNRISFVPTWLARLPLRVLCLEGNSLKYLPRTLAHCGRLEQLSLAFNPQLQVCLVQPGAAAVLLWWPPSRAAGPAAPRLHSARVLRVGQAHGRHHAAAAGHPAHAPGVPGPAPGAHQVLERAVPQRPGQGSAGQRHWRAGQGAQDAHPGVVASCMPSSA